MSWSFVYRPVWIIGHVIVTAIVSLTVVLGLWQLDRLDQRKQLNAQLRAAASAPAVTVADGTSLNGVGEYRRATVAGVPLPHKTVYERYPLNDGQPGFHVLTPYRLADGTALIVNRGWIPLDDGKDDMRPAETGSGPVTVEGVLRESGVDRAPVGATSGAAATAVPTVTAVDTNRIGQLTQTPSLAPVWLQRTGIATVGEPVPVEVPTINEGSHFSYALQWFGFGAIGLVGWAVVLYRAAREA